MHDADAAGDVSGAALVLVEQLGSLSSVASGFRCSGGCCCCCKEGLKSNPRASICDEDPRTQKKSLDVLLFAQSDSMIFSLSNQWWNNPKRNSVAAEMAACGICVAQLISGLIETSTK